MKIWKKIGFTLLSAVMVFSVAACGGGTSGTGGSEKETDKNKLVLKQTGGQELAIEYLFAGFGHDPYIAVANAFMEKHPEYQVKLYPNKEIKQTIGLMLESGSPSDLADVYITSTDPGTIKKWAGQGYLANIDDVYSTKTLDGRTVEESIDTLAKKALDFEGKNYGIPEYISFHGFIYNKDLFNQYGWTIPNTTAELKTLCEKIISDTNGKVDPITWFNDAQGYVYFASHDWVSQYEGFANMDKFYQFGNQEVFNPVDNTYGSIGTGKQKALETLFDFFRPINEGGYAFNNSRKVDYTNAQLRVLRGQSAMCLGGTWFENEMSLYLTDQNMGIFPVPEMSDNDGNVLHADGYTTEGTKRVLEAEYSAYHIVPKNAKNLEGAKEYLAFIASAEACEIYTKYAKTLRPFEYNKSINNPVYEGISEYGKDILGYSDKCMFFIPIAESLPAVEGGATMFWKSLRADAEVLAPGASKSLITKILNDDYAFAKQMWKTHNFPNN